MLAGRTDAPVDDFGLVDDEPAIIDRLQARRRPHCTVDIDHHAATATDEVMVVIVYPVLVVSGGSRGLDTPDEALVGQDAKSVVHGLSRHDPNVGPH